MKYNTGGAVERGNRAFKRGSLAAARNIRLPSVLLAASLEKLLLDICNKKISFNFREPVDLNMYPKYREIITHPMSLATIRDKLAKCEYLDLDSFVKDFQQIATNSSIFNGPDSDITKQAHKLVTVCKECISLEKGPLASQEEDVKTRYKSLNRWPQSESKTTATLVPNVLAQMQSASSSTSLKVVNDQASDKRSSTDYPISAPPLPKEDFVFSMDIEDNLFSFDDGEEEVLEEG